MKENYQLALDKTIEKIKKEGNDPSLLLHVCCAPCSSYVLEYLCEYFNITLFFYNPNISPESEHNARLVELQRLVLEMGMDEAVKIVSGEYEPSRFYELSKGLEELDEGGMRCYECYKLRLSKTAKTAKDGGYDYFTTTLSISPHKNAEWLNEIGKTLEKEYGIPYLVSDFKKRNGYKRSCELSLQYNLYRQNYCGCEFSRKAAEKRKANDILRAK